MTALARRTTAAALCVALAVTPVAPSRAQMMPMPGASSPSGIVPIGTPISLGGTPGNSGTTIVITTGANAPVGSVIIIGCGGNGDFTTMSVVDGTNTYTTAAIANNTGLSSTGILGAQLNSGSTITVTGSATIADSFCGAAYVTGLSTATPDKTVTAAANTATTASLTQANEVAFGMARAFNGGSNPGAVSMTSGFTILNSATNTGTNKFSLALAYLIVAATTAVTFSWSATITVSSSTVVTYKGN